MTTFAISTLGCKVNAYESQGYAQGLRDLGFQEVFFKEAADIYIINTCAVTNTAAAKSRQKLHQAQKLNDKALIAVVGCYAQSEFQALSKDPRIHVLIGSNQKEELPKLILSAWENKSHIHKLSDMRSASVFEAIPVRSFTHQTRAYLKIQDGCNQFCSYCIIPFARGKERSLHPDQVIAQARALVANGHLEIVLTGIHTGRYGREYSTTLTELLKRMCDEVKGLQRIRISSIEINEITDEFIQLMKQETKIARHLHIPIQSGNNDILKLMNRPYTISDYEKRINEIRKQITGISISTDVITGFPDESEAQFEDGCDCLKRLQFSFLHVFPFSKRDGTKAALMKNQLNNQIKKQRSTRLNALSEELYQRYQEGFVKQQVAVLWEEEANGMISGHTSEYLKVYAPYEASSLHQLEVRRISAYENDMLLCEQEVIG